MENRTHVLPDHPVGMPDELAELRAEIAELRRQLRTLTTVVKSEMAAKSGFTEDGACPASSRHRPNRRHVAGDRPVLRLIQGGAR